LKMELTQCSETSAFNTQMPGKYPEDNLSIINLFVFSQTKQYFISRLIDNTFRLSDQHQAIFTNNLKQVTCSAAHYINVVSYGNLRNLHHC
jgi:hypothetical protein